MEIKKSIVELLRVLGHRWRLSILILLQEGSMSSYDLRHSLSLLFLKGGSVPGTSFHSWMIPLCNLGLVAKERDKYLSGYKYTLTPLGSAALEVYSFAVEKMEKGLKERQLEKIKKIEENEW